MPQSSTIGETPKKRQFLRKGVKKNRLEIFKGFRRTSFLSHAPCRCGLRRNGQMREISFGRGRRRCRRRRKDFGQPERFAGLLATAAFRQSPPLPLFAFFLHILFHLIFGSPITTSDLFPKTTGKFFIRMLFTLGQIIRIGINSMDVCLPMIVRSSYKGEELIPIAILHGIALEVSVPFLINVFC